MFAVTSRVGFLGLLVFFLCVSALPAGVIGIVETQDQLGGEASGINRQDNVDDTTEAAQAGSRAEAQNLGRGSSPETGEGTAAWFER